MDKNQVFDEKIVISGMESEILRYIALGYQSKEIAVLIERSKPTVETYVRMLCAKLGARSRAHLVARAYGLGLLTVTAPFDGAQ